MREMSLFANRKLMLLTVTAMGLAALLVAIVLSPAGARAACSPDQFTVNGVFDLQGYLACEAASLPPVVASAAGGTGAGGTATTVRSGGGLPVTGSDTMQIVGIALAIVAVGIAAVVVSLNDRRRRV